jgi:hypothetical protein
MISVMGGYSVAPGITSDKYDASMQLEAFEQRCLQWVLQQAKRLSEDDESGLAILMLATSLMEPMGAILKSSKTDKAEFAVGFAYLFPKIKGSDNAYKVGERAFDLLRSGLYHEAFIKRGLAIEHQGDAIELRDGGIIVNPRTFLTEVEEGFRRFCEEVRKDKELNANFYAYFKKLDENASLKMAGTTFAYNGQGTATFSGPTIEFKK